MVKKPHVVVLVIDSLRHDRMGIGGHSPSPSVFLDSFCQRGMNMANAFTVGSPTEFSYPSLTTSTYPLDFGGYDDGITSRPVTLSEVMQRSGYETVSFVRGVFRSFCGYERGYDHDLFVLDLNRFLVNCAGTVSYYSRGLSLDDRRRERYVKILVHYLRTLFSDMLEYALFMEESLVSLSIPKSSMLHRYPFLEIADVAREALELLESDAEKLVHTVAKNSARSPVRRLFKCLRRSRQQGDAWIDAASRGFLIRGLLDLGGRILRRQTGLRSAVKPLRQLISGHRRSVLFASAAYSVDALLNWVDRRSSSKPLFSWVHIMDVHEQNMLSFDIHDDHARAKRDLQEAHSFYSRIKAEGSRDYRGSPFYDCSVRYVDAELQRLSQGFAERGLLDNTLWVVVADHGHYSTGWPVRPQDKLARDFYDEYYHVPLAFVGPDVAASRVEGLYSTLDMAPTLLSLLGIEIPSEFRGRVIDPKDDKGRKYVMMEHMGPGPCDMDEKPMRLCVRSTDYKVVYLADIHTGSLKGRIAEIYDLRADPDEMHNVANDPAERSAVSGLVRVLEERALRVLDYMSEND